MEILRDYSEFVCSLQASSVYPQSTGTGWRKGRNGKGAFTTGRTWKKGPRFHIRRRGTPDAKPEEGRSAAGCDSNSPAGFQGYSAWTIDALGVAIHRQHPQVDREIMEKAGGGKTIDFFY